MPLTIGSPAIVRSSSISADYTRILLENPATEDGVIETVEIYAYSNMANCKVGTFERDNANFRMRDYATLGDVPAGSKQTFTELHITMLEGDYLGIFWNPGTLYADMTGYAGIYARAGDNFDADWHSYGGYTYRTYSCEGIYTGAPPPLPPHSYGFIIG